MRNPATVPALAAVALTAAAVAVAVGGAAAIASPAAAEPHDGTYLIGCDSAAVARPASFTLSCADGALSLNDLRWDNWGGRSASASAVIHSRGCTPDCAHGADETWAVHVKASAAETSGPSTSYTKLEISADQPRPDAAESTLTLELPVHHDSDSGGR